MSIQINEARPPYAQFFTRAEEDRTASEVAGHVVYREVDFVAITPQGSKDRIERYAEDWLRHIAREADVDRFDKAWVAHYRQQYADFKLGKETPANGTPITEWPVASIGQVKTLLGINVRTVEDLAQCNEETLLRLGMGGRALKDKAVAWLATANDVGKVTERIASLEVENAQLKADNKTLSDNCATLKLQLESLQKAQAAVATLAPKSAKGHEPTGDVEFN